MLYFLLPKIYPNIYTKLTCTSTPENTTGIVQNTISQSLSYYLHNIKEKIKGREDEWDACKKYTNPYEYIHTSIPYKKKSVAKHKPLSRAYFKMIEILHAFNLHQYDKPLKSFHLAEGPGGFIEALAQLRNSLKDSYIGMTLLDDENDENIPAWKKTRHFLLEYPSVCIENGADGTGNILSLENLDYCYHKYGSSMQIITGDGGFDFSVDFNNQESNMSRLLFAQICYALCMQSTGGSFVLKIFDCFTDATLELLYLLTSCYRKVYITKPQTSRYANSEKYIVCQGFLHESTEPLYPCIRNAFQMMIQTPQNHTITHFISNPLPYYFYKKIEEYNAIFGQQQIENIHMTLLLMDNKKGEKIEAIIKYNIQKCLQWCVKYNIQCSSIFKTMEYDESDMVSEPLLEEFV